MSQRPAALPRIWLAAIVTVAAAGCLLASNAAAQEDPENASQLAGQVVLVTKAPAGADVDRLVEQLESHLRARVKDSTVTNVLKGAGGRIILEARFPAHQKLVFEKMVAELPTVEFRVPITVESWNLNPLDAPVPTPGVEPSVPPEEGIALSVNTTTDRISSLNFKEVPLRDVLSYLAQHLDLQYMCSGTVGRRLVTAQLRSVTLETFLEGLRRSLDLDVERLEGFYVFSARERLPDRGATAPAAEGAPAQ